MKYAFFLGCTIPARAMNYEVSTRKIADKLGIELVDLQDFDCCGFPVKSVDSFTTIVMAAKNIAVAEEKGIDICTLCNGCVVTLAEANHELKHNEELKKRVNKELSKIGREFKGTIEIKHLARILYEDVGVENIKKAVKFPLDDFKLAAHYGCHYFKPSIVYGKFEDPEFPTSLDKLIEATGAPEFNYSTKTDCCGGGILGVTEDVALKMAQTKLDDLKKEKADAMISICPFCSVMYDANQKSVEKIAETEYNLPVLYYTQVLGLALGVPPDELEFKRNRIKPKEMIKKFDEKYGENTVKSEE
ncbi:CoB--CoM heterodisulfide reductase subunit B [candidate division WOR-3 bacterium]|nr:CoB--CoM heterodisulfide reductase subunit B [candidate division WOR-3 bacterium]